MNVVWLLFSSRSIVAQRILREPEFKCDNKRDVARTNACSNVFQIAFRNNERLLDDLDLIEIQIGFFVRIVLVM